jgi:hypothetical protein
VCLLALLLLSLLTITAEATTRSFCGKLTEYLAVVLTKPQTLRDFYEKATNFGPGALPRLELARAAAESEQKVIAKILADKSFSDFPIEELARFPTREKWEALDDQKKQSILEQYLRELVETQLSHTGQVITQGAFLEADLNRALTSPEYSRHVAFIRHLLEEVKQQTQRANELHARLQQELSNLPPDNSDLRDFQNSREPEPMPPALVALFRALGYYEQTDDQRLHGQFFDSPRQAFGNRLADKVLVQGEGPPPLLSSSWDTLAYHLLGHGIYESVTTKWANPIGPTRKPDWSKLQKFDFGAESNDLNDMGKAISKEVKGKAFVDLGCGDPYRTVMPRALAELMGATSYTGVDAKNVSTLDSGINVNLFNSRKPFLFKYQQKDLLKYVSESKDHGPKFYFIEGIEVAGPASNPDKIAGEKAYQEGRAYLQKLAIELQKKAGEGDNLLIGPTVSFLGGQPSASAPSDHIDLTQFGFELVGSWKAGTPESGNAVSGQYCLWRRKR